MLLGYMDGFKALEKGEGCYEKKVWGKVIYGALSKSLLDLPSCEERLYFVRIGSLYEV